MSRYTFGSPLGYTTTHLVPPSSPRIVFLGAATISVLTPDFSKHSVDVTVSGVTVLSGAYSELS